MKSIYLVRNGAADRAFEVRETAMPTPTDGQVLIKVEAFGLNYADVMARLGMYDDAPPLPAVLGYEVVGRVTALGAGVSNVKIGDRVVAMTRFGGYAEYAIASAQALGVIPDAMPAGEATALATQYITAYHAACEQVRLQEGDRVLIHAAAGGVGIALVQLAKAAGCIIYGTAGSDAKLEFLTELGVDFPINYQKQDWAKVITELRGDAGIDVIFDSIGGASVAKGIKLLASGGRMVSYGAAEMSSGNKKSLLQTLKVAAGFGIYSPIQLLTSSKAFIGINMLRIADNKPHIVQRCTAAVIQLHAEGVAKPFVGGTFAAEAIAEAHDFLASRASIGKVVCVW